MILLSISPRAKKVVDAFKLYAQTMEKLDILTDNKYFLGASLCERGA